MDYMLLSELSLQRQNCKIKARMCRIWESTSPYLKGDIFGLECLLVDEKGYSMQGTIRKQDAEELRCHLKEGGVYMIEKFNIIPSRKKYVAVDRLYMIQINKWTCLTLLTEDVENIPLYSFNFSSFSEVENRRYNDTILTDVLGQITAIGEISQKYVGQVLTPIRNLEIQDLEKNVLSITLWDKFASDFDDEYISVKGSSKPIVIVLAGMTVRSFKEKIHLSTCSASRIYIDLEIVEALEFINRLQPSSNLIERITTSQTPIMSPQEELSVNRKTVAELLELDISSTQDMKFTCQAKIIEIDTSFGWWYKACYNCKSSIKTYDDTFWCSNCGKNDQSPIPWYKLNAIVGDSTGTTNFTIFGKLAQDLIHVPAQNLAASPGADRFTLTPTIKTIIGQEHIFQLVLDTQRFKSTIPSFKVLKIFTANFSAKGKTPVVKKLFAECGKQLLAPSDDKQIKNELFEDTSSALAVSSSYPQPIVGNLEVHQISNESFEEASSALAISPICPQPGADNSEVQPAKRHRKMCHEPTQEDTQEDAERSEDEEKS